eukprot:g7144.t1
MLDTMPFEVEATERNDTSSSRSGSNGKAACEQRLGCKEKGLLGGTWSCKTFSASSSTQPPSTRGGCSWTKVGSRLLLFGGADAHQQHFADIHAFDEKTGKWKKLTVRGTAPSPRSGHSAVALGESLIVYGGMNWRDGVTFNDIFELRPGSAECMEWVSLPCASTPPRNSHAAVLDGETMIIVGATGVLRDLFSLDTDSWTWRRLKDAPFARCAHSACFVEAAGVMAVFGGWDGGTTVASDLHLFTVRTGEWITPSMSPRPAGRFAHAACTSTEGTSMLVFGGVSPGEDLDDVLELSKT